MFYLILMCCVLGAHVSFAQINQPQPTQAKVHVAGTPSTLNITIHTDPSYQNNNTVVNTNLLTSFQQQIQAFVDYTKSGQDYVTTKFTHFSDFMIAYAKENSMQLSLGAVGALYAGIWLRFMYLHHLIFRKDTWSCWKNKTDLNELQSIAHAQLARELIVAIQKKYQAADKIADFVTPLMAFIVDMNKEIANLNSFIWQYESLKKIKLIALFPGYGKTMKLVREKLQRLMFLKNVFGSWMAEYKINMNMKIENSRRSINRTCSHSTLLKQQLSQMPASNKEIIDQFLNTKKSSHKQSINAQAQLANH